MTPYEVLKLFEDGYLEDIAPSIDDATAKFALWLSTNRASLTSDDWEILVGVGRTLLVKGIEARIIAREGIAHRATALLIQKLRSEKS
ncbi:hypothetical protein JOE11_004994 [Robbsia andropogonis]